MSKTTYLDFIDAVKDYYGAGSDQWVEIAKYGLKSDNAIDILKQIPNVDLIKNADGSLRGITYKDFTSMGGYSGNIANKINSNIAGGSASVNKSFNMKIPSNTKLNETSKTLEMASEIGTKTTGQKVIGVLGTIGQAVLAVGTACTLGKTIDKALYNLNPDFWNAHDMETLNPDTWASITNSGSVGDDLFNILMGVDPDTNETTAYVDQNALAYMALYLQNKDIFKEETNYIVDSSKITSDFSQVKRYVISDVKASKTSFAFQTLDDGSSDKRYNNVKTSIDTLMYSLENVSDTTGSKSYRLFTANKESYMYGYSFFTKEIDFSVATNINSYKYTVKNLPVETGGLNISGARFKNINSSVPIIKYKSGADLSVLTTQIDYLLLYESVEQTNGLDGVGTQDGATIPDLSNASSIDDVLDILKNTLPLLFANAITNSVPQPDGSIKDYTYVPISLPNTNNNNDAQPETGGQTQQKPQVNPDTSPDTLLDLITKLIGNKLDTPNTPDTGSGETPPSVIPMGSASALFKIYNPSQSEIDSFGAWLWSSNFVDQLLKVFNNPMESIIGLHKVYASPVIGGRSNIKVGYLDSGVNSNYVSNQYTKINCGTINLQEYFGNVFDYSPYTNIELYLPCIGFVTLNVGDVMRSSLSIIYTIDVLTGACLAEVKVIRDNAGGVLYSYSGNCASQYPLSSGSYMGIVSSAIGVAGSIIGTVASGGSLAPLALGSIGSALNAHTSVQHSGNLSGNSGVMGGKIPYLIISRPQTNMAENYQHLQGIPSNAYVKLSSCHGFTQVKNVNVENINAESSELDEIKTQLMNGVLI